MKITCNISKLRGGKDGSEREREGNIYGAGGVHQGGWHSANNYSSENPRWGLYKNHKNVTKNRSTRGNCWKTVIFSFGTASITSTRQFGAGAEKSWFLTRKSSGPLEIAKTEHLFWQSTSCWCSKQCSKQGIIFYHSFLRKISHTLLTQYTSCFASKPIPNCITNAHFGKLWEVQRYLII